MTTILVDSDYSDELLHINEDSLFEYGSPFAIDDLYPNQIMKSNEGSLESCRASDCSSEEEDFDFKMLQPHAPPPSPQDTSMLDMLFAKKLTSSLEACLEKKEEADTIAAATAADTQIYTEHAQSLDKLLRRTMSQQQSRGINKKSHKRSGSLQSSRQQITDLSISWQTRAKNQKILNIAKATEQAEKLKKALQKHLIDEETSVMINELKDMGL